MPLNRYFLLSAFLALALGASSQEVYTAGMARSVMTGSDLSAHVKLDTLLMKPHLYGLGPAENLQGEVTVIDGNPYVSALRGDSVYTEIDEYVRLPFFAYAYVAQWDSLRIETSIADKSQFQFLVDSLARMRGMDMDSAFPFRLKATWNQVDYHIIMRDTTEAQHSHEAHNKAKVNFSESNFDADLLGFFSRHHEGVFTHKGEYIHIHLLSADRKISAHLDSIYHSGLFTLYLPAISQPN